MPSTPPPANAATSFASALDRGFTRLTVVLTEGRWPALKTGFACWLLSLLLSSPSLFMWSRHHVFEHSRAHDLLALAADPFARDLNEPITAYRLTLPLLAHLLHLPPLATLALPYLTNIACLALVFAALRRRVAPATALLGTAVIALSFTVMWCNWQPGFGDSLSHALAASLLLAASAPWVFAATFLGTLNDERMVLALPFLFLWHFPLRRQGDWFSRFALIWCAAALAGIGTYLIAREALSAGWIGPGLSKPAVYTQMTDTVDSFRPVLGSWTSWAYNTFMSFRWAWILPAFLVLARWRAGSRIETLVFAGALAAGSLSTIIVQDVARSIGFMFVAWLLAIVGTITPGRDHERLLKFTVLALCLTPVAYSIQQLELMWMRPLPIVLFQCLVQP